MRTVLRSATWLLTVTGVMPTLLTPHCRSVAPNNTAGALLYSRGLRLDLMSPVAALPSRSHSKALAFNRINAAAPAAEAITHHEAACIVSALQPASVCLRLSRIVKSLSFGLLACVSSAYGLLLRLTQCLALFLARRSLDQYSTPTGHQSCRYVGDSAANLVLHSATPTHIC